jgi:hypothetical protein
VFGFLKLLLERYSKKRKFINRRKSLTNPGNTSLQFDIKRLTALWGFSEATLGGILHALRIPFTGIFIGSAAIIFISLIAISSKEKSTILKSTIVVILIKAVVSPYTPLAAYAAVFIQGTLGYTFFNFIKSQNIAAVLLGFFSLLFSALQKVILLTVVFGYTLWKSIDLFVGYVFQQFGLNPNGSILNISYLMILVYITIHIVVGIYIGTQIKSLPHKIKNKYNSIDSDFILSLYTENYFAPRTAKKKKAWWLRPTGVIFLLLFTALIVISYLSPDLNKDMLYDSILMLIRSMMITFIWLVFISPYIYKRFKNVIEKNKFKYANEINNATELFPHFFRILNYSWKESSGKIGMERIKFFLSNSLALLLIVEINKTAD